MTITAPVDKRAGVRRAREIIASPWRRAGVGYAALALLTYLPLLLTDRKTVAADTKSYLYLDPSRVLARAPYMWDNHIGMGTVTHQNIGYLFPSGPYYWLCERVGLPDWVAQRLWLGTILFAAACGVLYLARTIALRGAGAPIAALAYAFSPYVLDYAARISVMLLPFAGLAWLIAFTIRALRRGGWRYPALFAITVQCIGGSNATALLLVGVAPILAWIHLTAVTREVEWRRALLTGVRIAGLTMFASLWWISGLWAQGGYGINILRFTETVRAVAKTAAVPELLRGMGYWFFYGQDKLGPWVESSSDYTQHLWLIILSFTIPALGIAAFAAVRWIWAPFFAVLLIIGIVIGVGAHPYDAPAPLGGLFKSFADSSTAGLALRSTARAVPLVVLALTLMLGAGATLGVAWLRHRLPNRPWVAIGAAMALGVLVLASFPTLWNGNYYANNLTRPEQVPQYWQAATRALDARPADTRILELPGADFASYRWGATVDPITPGLMDRPYVARELIPYGSDASADLLNALDRRLQEGTLSRASLAPMARYMGVGDVVLRNDLQVDRYNLVRPTEVMASFVPSPSGFGAAVQYGTTIPGALRYPLRDEQALGRLRSIAEPAPVVVLPVAAPLPIVRSAPADRMVVLAGNGDGLVNTTAAGLLDGGEVVLYSAGDDRAPAELRSAAGSGAALVLTDTNRRQARRWSTVADNLGVTEAAGEAPLVPDPSDARLAVFPNANDAAYTVVEARGVARVTATGYGNPISYTPEDRAARALDGDPATAWRVGAFSDVTGETWRVDTLQPVMTDHITLMQPLNGARNRWITRVSVLLDGRVVARPTLGDVSRTSDGQRVGFARQQFSRLEIRIDDTNVGRQYVYDGWSSVGLAEVGIVDDRTGALVRVDEVLRLPSDLLTTFGSEAQAHSLSVVLERARVRPVPPRYDEELSMARVFTLPGARQFGLTAQGQLRADAPDDRIDSLVGYRSLDAGGVRATSSEHLAGDLSSRARAAFDDDPTTAWVSPFLLPGGNWIQLQTATPVTVDSMNLAVVADGEHSVPTRVRVSIGDESRDIAVPDIADRSTPTGVVTIPLQFAPMSGNTARVTVLEVRAVRTLDTYSRNLVAMPVAIAEAGLPGFVSAERPPMMLPDACRSDVLTVAGNAIPVRAVGPTASALRGEAFTMQACDATLSLPAGDVEVRTTPGGTTGIDVDRIVLASAPGGTATNPNTLVAPGNGGVAPEYRIASSGPVAVRAVVPRVTEPFWFVLGQSNNAGWRLQVTGAQAGPRSLVNGYANGWRITPDASGGPVVLRAEWTPQRWVWRAIGISALALLMCVLIVGYSWARAWRYRANPDARHWSSTMEDRDALRLRPWPILAAPRRSVVDAAVRVLALGGVAWLVAGLGVAGAVIVVALVATIWPRLRWWAPLLSALMVFGCGVVVAVEQYRNAFPPVFEWPTFFPALHPIAWAAVLWIVVPFVCGPRRARLFAIDSVGLGKLSQ